MHTFREDPLKKRTGSAGGIETADEVLEVGDTSTLLIGKNVSRFGCERRLRSDETFTIIRLAFLEMITVTLVLF